jgi:6-pyruvoyltetrahydropterin/6-carboxytetrahydropterin synthase
VFELTVDIPFSAAHKIEGHPGPCARLHGHNYRAVITVAGDRLNHLGMLIDFGELKQVCAEVIDPLDHSFLNELPAFADTNPTAEAIARHLYQHLSAALQADPQTGIHVARVTVYESDRSAATYQE